MDDLFTCDYEDRKNVNCDRIPGTCEWFTNHPLFGEFNDNSDSRLLWVSADPGCGKSVLAKYLVDEILPTPGRTVSYFFFKDGFPDQQSASVAMCSLIRQILLKRPDLLTLSMLHRMGREGKALFKSASALFVYLMSIAGNEEADEVVCVLDALDECHHKDFIGLSHELRRWFLHKNHLNIKFLLLSRPYQHIQWEFQELEDFMPTIHLSGESEIEVAKITIEIDMVIGSRVQSVGQKRKLQKEECEHLQTLLTAVSHRTYLWVTLTLDVIENMHGFTKGNVIKAVQRLPQTLDEAYNKILDRSPNAPKALRALQAVIIARRPLTIREIKVYLLHQTAREFLSHRTNPDAEHVIQNTDKSSDQLAWKYAVRPEEADAVVAEACIRYLTIPMVINQANSLFDTYALVFWNEHFIHSSICSHDETTRLALRLVDPQALWRRVSGVQHKVAGLDTATSSSYVLSSTYGSSIKVTGSLIPAALLGLHQVVKLLLETTDIDMNAKDHGKYERLPLFWVAENDYGYTEIVKLLVACPSIDLNLLNGAGWSPLWHATFRQSHSAVKLLLSTNRLLLAVPEINLDAETKLGNTALMTAARAGNKSLAKDLIRVGADVNKRNSNGVTALELAARKGHQRVVKLLLETRQCDEASIIAS
ncbi:hypothetical protein BU23DRAFT_664180 [Bimuria novae-zelandiae CBS 107.79]|uniref:Uncharacterized protein n=1 Tax=Bimuria novae-zelandiae CBS 107.79 TaxID=1447943 RepID=A0A6A5UNI3_9PLEO|nr:hypothetical protein BU23DRAFT_664180 [Bimuria novae-zelandiae CBS 107.79]